ncbi:DUF2141 domain-containing protein [Nodularia harveyana UHCC-0300]|uniref:DUF2141 domain-containing protein n=1 Tax=Nodularia harveyana UHCC-0300 TaxID=2974287 RepID=A0ABU5UAW9_9CYAN|nr:DUF2141 domain-containing protein [Nodularia harveyana]MEA5580682.1 DUF2141 domain-containing protein [Nodularia harveyana UHCC-0300]
MWNLTVFKPIILGTLLSIGLGNTVNAEAMTKLTVVVDGIKHKTGEICLGVYPSAKGFPMSTNDVIKSACLKPKGDTLTHVFSGLKPGNYAVAIVDDQNGDRQLNKDFLGIPKEGFGISQNPTVSVFTGTPKFNDASFLLIRNQNTTINILMKYSLDS